MRHLLSALLLLALPGGLFALGHAQQAHFARFMTPPSTLGLDVEGLEKQLVQAIADGDSPLYLGRPRDHQRLVRGLLALERREYAKERAEALLALAQERWPDEFPEEGALPSERASNAAQADERAPEDLLTEAQDAQSAHRYREANEAYEAACKAWQASDHPEEGSDALVAWSQLRMSMQGFPEAEQLLKGSLALQRQHLSDGSQLPRTLKLLDRAARAQDLRDPAGQHQAEVVKLTEAILTDAGRQLPPEHPELARLKLTLAELSLERGDETHAILYYRAALEKLAFPDPEDQKRVAPAQVALAQLLVKRGEVEPAIAAYKAAQRLYLSALGPDAFELGHVERELGRLYLLPGVDQVHGGDSLRVLTDAERIYASAPAAEAAERLDARLLLAQAQLATSNLTKAHGTLRLLDDDLTRGGTSAQVERKRRLQKELDQRAPLPARRGGSLLPARH